MAAVGWTVGAKGVRIRMAWLNDWPCTRTKEVEGVAIDAAGGPTPVALLDEEVVILGDQEVFRQGGAEFVATRVTDRAPTPG